MKTATNKAIDVWATYQFFSTWIAVAAQLLNSMPLSMSGELCHSQQNERKKWNNDKLLEDYESRQETQFSGVEEAEGFD